MSVDERPPPADRRLVTTTEAHQTWGVAAATVRKWASRGVLAQRAMTSSGQPQYWLVDVLELRDQHRRRLLTRQPIGTGQTAVTLSRSHLPPVCLPGGFVVLGGAIVAAVGEQDLVVPIRVRPVVDPADIAALTDQIKSAVRAGFQAGLGADTGEGDAGEQPYRQPA